MPNPFDQFDTAPAAQPAQAGGNPLGGLNADLGDPVPGLPTTLPVAGKRNEAFLQTLNPGIASYVKAVSEGRAKVPEGMIMRTPFGQQLLMAVSKYDPSFDVANVTSRTAMRKSATSGQIGQNIASLNTVMGHLKTLYDSIDPLHNSNSPFWNAAVANPLSAEEPNTWMGGLGAALSPVVGHDVSYQNALKNFSASREAAASELTKAFRGATGNEADIKAYKELFSENDSPEALKTAVKRQIKLLESRLHSVAEQYNRGMGTSAQPQQFLAPENAKIFNELLGSGQQQGGGAAGPAKPGADPLGLFQ